MTKYLLPCTCGKSLTVEKGQAGQTVHCSCGVDLDVPSFGHLRQLPVATEVAPPKPPPQQINWSIARGLVFAVGLTTLVAGLGVAGVFQWRRSQLSLEKVVWDDLDEDVEEIGKLGLLRTMDSWRLITERGIGEYRPPLYVVRRAWSVYWWTLVCNALWVAATGALLLGIIYLIPQRKKVRKRQPRKKSS